MASIDLDRKSKDRMDGLWKRYRDGAEIEVDDIFLSEHVLNVLDDQKMFFQSFRTNRLLSPIPFSPTVFVKICPACIDDKNFQTFAGLVKGSLIIPVMGSALRHYPHEVAEVVKTRPHVLTYEYQLFRRISIDLLADEGLCTHCVKKRQDEIEKSISGSDANRFKRHLSVVLGNIFPYVAPDFEILDAMATAVKDKSLEKAAQVSSLSYVLHAIRDAQVFQAPILLSDVELERAQGHDIAPLQRLRSVGFELRELISDGLALRIPADLPIEKYVGLVKEVRPDILKVTSRLLEEAHNRAQNEVSVRTVFNAIAHVNREVDRIQTSTRHLLLSAVVSSVQNNKEVLTGMLLAGALGLTSGAIACVAGGLAGAGTKALKKRGIIKGSVALERFGSALHRDLQPAIHRLVASYVGSTTVPIQVMAIQQAIQSADAQSPRHVVSTQKPSAKPPGAASRPKAPRKTRKNG
jgi:hypothetical protein